MVSQYPDQVLAIESTASAPKLFWGVRPSHPLRPRMSGPRLKPVFLFLLRPTASKRNTEGDICSKGDKPCLTNHISDPETAIRNAKPPRRHEPTVTRKTAFLAAPAGLQISHAPNEANLHRTWHPALPRVLLSRRAPAGPKPLLREPVSPATSRPVPRRWPPGRRPPSWACWRTCRWGGAARVGSLSSC